MKILRIFSLIAFMGLAAACQKQVPQSEVVHNAIAFCETFYDLDYAATKELVVPASLPYLSYMATNTTQELIDKVNAKGPVVVTVISEQMNPEEGHASKRKTKKSRSKRKPKP